MPDSLPTERGEEAEPAPTEDAQFSVGDMIEDAEPEPPPEGPDEEQEGPGIEDTLELLEAVKESHAVALHFVEGDIMEGSQAALNLWDEYEEALDGIEDVPEEITDLDAQEIEKIGEKALAIAKQFAPSNDG